MKFSLITIYGAHVKASMVLTRADHLFIHNYIRSLLNNIVYKIHFIKLINGPDEARTRVLLLVCLMPLSHTGSYIHVSVLTKQSAAAFNVRSISVKFTLYIGPVDLYSYTNILTAHFY